MSKEVDPSQSSIYVEEVQWRTSPDDPDDPPELRERIDNFCRTLVSAELDWLVVSRLNRRRIVAAQTQLESAEGLPAGTPVLRLSVSSPRPGGVLYDFSDGIPGRSVMWNGWYQMTGVSSYRFAPQFIAASNALCAQSPMTPASLQAEIGEAFRLQEAKPSRLDTITVPGLAREVVVLAGLVLSQTMYQVGLSDGPQPGVELTELAESVQPPESTPASRLAA